MTPWFKVLLLEYNCNTDDSNLESIISRDRNIDFDKCHESFRCEQVYLSLQAKEAELSIIPNSFIPYSR